MYKIRNYLFLSFVKYSSYVVENFSSTIIRSNTFSILYYDVHQFLFPAIVIKDQDTQFSYKVTLRRVRVTIFSVVKQSIFHIMSVFVFLCQLYGTQDASFLHHTVICRLPGSAYFSTLSHKRHNFRKKEELLNLKCVF